MPVLNDHEAGWDAETLAEAEEIKKDKNRLNKAKAAAKVIAKDKEKSAEAMKDVAGGSTAGVAPKNTISRVPPKNTVSRNVNVKQIKKGIKLSGTGSKVIK